MFVNQCYLNKTPYSCKFYSAAPPVEWLRHQVLNIQKVCLSRHVLPSTTSKVRNKSMQEQEGPIKDPTETHKSATDEEDLSYVCNWLKTIFIFGKTIAAFYVEPSRPIRIVQAQHILDLFSREEQEELIVVSWGADRLSSNKYVRTDRRTDGRQRRHPGPGHLEARKPIPRLILGILHEIMGVHVISTKG
ncbi:hypothetical protein WA026_008233 [Henosepilachna vigintioctopunctata]|uniref:Uncharacterized protein n=1 Tax=Henosepilachna vigintioctopunctata TaxID=420089 RepID=A0AAW1TPS6_9CUCU